MWLLGGIGRILRSPPVIVISDHYPRRIGESPYCLSCFERSTHDSLNSDKCYKVYFCGSWHSNAGRHNEDHTVTSAQLLSVTDFLGLSTDWCLIFKPHHMIQHIVSIRLI